MQFVETHGERVPAIGLGTWAMQGDACRQAVVTALRLGYRHLDTATAYENEAEVGRALAESAVSRDDLFLTTKVWVEDLDPPALHRSVEASLSRLGTDYVDLLLIHWPPHDTDLLRRAFAALREVQDNGRARHLGVSNFTPSLLALAERHIPVFCNQVEYHPYLEQSKLVRIARERGHLLGAYCPVARGRVLNDPVIAEIASGHDKSPAQVVLRWLVEQPNVAAIPKAASSAHLEENVDIFDFALTADEHRRIADLNREERLSDLGYVTDWER